MKFIELRMLDNTPILISLESIISISPANPARGDNPLAKTHIHLVSGHQDVLNEFDVVRKALEK